MLKSICLPHGEKQQIYGMKSVGNNRYKGIVLLLSDPVHYNLTGTAGVHGLKGNFKVINRNSVRNEW